MGSPEAAFRRPPTRSTIRSRIGGGFQVVRGRSVWLEATLASGGLRVERGASARWFLERASEGEGAGFVLRAGARKSGSEAARSTRLPLGAGRELAGTHLVASDGRCFALMVDLDERSFRLMSWEGFGPYAYVATRGSGWTFEATPAGVELANDAELMAVLAAELLDVSVDERTGTRQRTRKRR